MGKKKGDALAALFGGDLATPTLAQTSSYPEISSTAHRWPTRPMACTSRDRRAD